MHMTYYAFLGHDVFCTIVEFFNILINKIDILTVIIKQFLKNTSAVSHKCYGKVIENVSPLINIILDRQWVCV